MYSLSTCDHTVHSRDDSFRQINPFGASTIQGFKDNVADMKKLAARDFEDILQVSLVHVVLSVHCKVLIMFQCSIPCFEGLLPAPHDDSVQSLLYLASYWHSLAKLRVHTETTLSVLDHTTALFAKSLRHFKEVICPCFDTVETDHEYKARRRAAEHRMSRQRTQTVPSTSKGAKRCKTFNLLTSKFHALGDYVNTIKMFGTTDSYSTQIVST
jgi:hypothetical protein